MPGRGKLKIFLGAAPGVGKTYEMLLSARAQKAAGVDVVAGVIETHGRAETQALLAGLEIIPKRKIEYRGRILEEMDLAALVTRKPQLALVDELAHTNVFGSQHPKRYQDVEDLLAAGIDVYTTLNIQHTESLNDVVAQITKIRVRETVPDSVLQAADEIEVIDLTPAELMQRLRDGKVYIPAQAERALRNYFTPGNLTALRELALRRAAQQVDDQLLSHMRANAIQGPWPAGERVLVCISEDLRSAGLVRYAKRMADRLRAPWTVLYLETPRVLDLSTVEKDRIADTLRLGERLGGTAATLPGTGTIASDILDYARANNVTTIIIGKSTRSRWFELINGSVVHDLLRQSGAISVHVIAGDEADPIPKKTVKTAPATAGDGALGYLIALLATALSLAVAEILQPYFGGETVPLIFLMAVTGVAYRFGLWPSLLAAFASMLCYNFFFLPPLYTFTIADPINVAALFFFLFSAIVVSNLTARIRRQAETALARAAITNALYGYARNLASLATLDDLVAAATAQLATSLRCEVAVLLPNEKGDILEVESSPRGVSLKENELAAARWAFANGKAAGRGAETLPGANRLCLPMRTARGVIGVVALGPNPRPTIILTPDERRFVDALLDQTAVAIERVRLASEMDETRVQAAAERLRAALVSSLSHDLKTPLAAIHGAATSLHDYDALLDPQARAELLTTLREESDRLSRFVVNLLDMTRIEAGALEPHREPTDLGEQIGSVLHRMKFTLAPFNLVSDIASGLPLIDVDPFLLEQALVNVLDNAAKFAPEGSAIKVVAREDGSGVAVSVVDEGPGIPSDKLTAIFEKFHRVTYGDRQRAGTGLGLAIAKGFIEAMGGTITASNRADRLGAIFTIRFPLPSPHNEPAAKAVGVPIRSSAGAEQTDPAAP
jgi:two-component system sensor histidine kinase KdpD